MVLALLLAVTASTPFDPRIVDALGPIHPSPGSWAEYVVRTAGRDDVRVRVTVLPAEEEGRYWLELAMAAQSGITSAARLLVHGKLPAAGIERLFLMLAGQQPIEIPLHRSQRAAPNRERVGHTRIWRASSVPLWGLVKARSKTQSIDLLACGASGGHSVFPPTWRQGKGSESAK